MKLVYSLAALAAQMEAAYNFQAVGFCGVPAVKFDEDILFSSQARSGSQRGPGGLRSASVESAYEDQEKLNVCENEATAEHEAYVASLGALDSGARSQDIATSIDSISEGRRALRWIERACQDTSDAGYPKKRLDKINQKGHDFTYLYNAFDELERQMTEADLTEMELPALWVHEVSELVEDIRDNHKRCWIAYARLAHLAENAKGANSYKKSNSANEVALIAEAVEEECTDSIKVVGGEDADAHAWPWQVYLSICGTFYGMMECNVCGGSIISDKWIVTAAHCVPNAPRGRILVGAHDLNDNNYFSYTMGEMTKHPRWNFPGRFENDIALTQAANGESFYIDWSVSTPICLPHADNCFSPETTCVVTGWGLTAERGSLADVLQVVGVRLMAREQCQAYTGYSRIAETMLCAGFQDGGHDACSGDSGGPLVCRMSSGAAKGAWVLHGVVSWGYGCARSGSPGIYTDVQAYLPWINDMTGLSPDSLLKVPGSDADTCMSDIDYNADNQFVEQPEEVQTNPIQIEESAAAVCNYEKLSNGQHTWFLNKDSEILRNGGESRSAAAETEITSITYEAHGQVPATECQWIWQNEHDDMFIEMDITAFLMDKCYLYSGSDQLSVVAEVQNADGSWTERKLCSTNGKPQKLRSKTGIKVNWKTGHRVVGANKKAGFALNVEYKDDTWHCDGQQKASFNSLSDNKLIMRTPNYPKNYDSQQECRWEIESKFDVEIYIRDLQTERSSKCNQAQDNLVFYTAEDCSSDTLSDRSQYKVAAAYCGRLKNKKNRIAFKDRLDASGNLLKICAVFAGDKDRKNGKGFHIEVKPVSAQVAQPVAVKTNKKKNNNKKRDRKNKKNRKRG